MAAANPVTHDSLIKRLYPNPDDVLIAMYDNNTLAAMLQKQFDGYGKEWTMPVRIAHTAGRSHDFSKAKANKAGSVTVDYKIAITKNYSLYSVDGQLQRQTSNNKGAFADAFEFELDSAMDAMKRNIGYEPYFNGGGAIGQVGTSPTGAAQITLSNINDIVKVEKGQMLAFSTNDGTTGTVKPGLVKVGSVDRDLGTINIDTAFAATFDAVGACPTIATSDFIFTDGDFGLGLKGFEAWNPVTAPTGGDSFFGLDRSVDPVRLSGSRLDLRTLGPEEQIQKMAQVSYRNGGKMSHVFWNDIDMLALILALGSRRQVANTEVEGKIGFEGVSVSTGYGKVEVYADYNAPQGIARGVELKNWALKGPGQFPFIEARDGGKLVREESADAFEGRIIAYYQMVCKKVAGTVRGRLT